MEHDLFGKPVSTHRVKPEGMLFRIRLYAKTAPLLTRKAAIACEARDAARCRANAAGSPMSAKLSKKELVDRIQALCVLVVDDNQYMRKMIRNLLVNCGVKDTYEAGDGITTLDTLRTVGADVVILDWEMPLLNGAELVRIVRSPGVFPMPDVPIIMLSGYGERWRVLEEARLGVNEYLVKPVSAKAIYDRLVSITLQPRPSVQLGDYYGPEPRRLTTETVETVDQGPSLVCRTRRTDLAGRSREIKKSWTTKSCTAWRPAFAVRLICVKYPARIPTPHRSVDRSPARNEILRRGPIPVCVRCCASKH